MEESKRV
jgi:hypothetical protein